MYIFVSSIGRSGTKFLSEIFNQVTNIPSFHGGESQVPDMRCCVGDTLTKFNNYIDTENIERKIKQIQQCSIGDNYFEASQLFMFSFVEKAIETLNPIYVIHLTRDPLQTAKSYMNRNSVPGNPKSVWRPPLLAKRNILQFNEKISLTSFQKNLWNWIENELRFHFYKNSFHKTFDFDFYEINDMRLYENLFKYFQIEYNREKLYKILEFEGEKNKNFTNANEKPTVISCEEVQEARELIDILKFQQIDFNTIDVFRNEYYFKYSFVREMVEQLSKKTKALTNNKPKFIVFGDSHAKFFNKEPQHKNFNVEVYSISGASIAGFGKRRSTLGTSELITRVIKTTKNFDKLILKFGQVDVDLGYYYRLVIKGENINFPELAKKLIDSYLLFVKQLPISKKKIHIFGINLPSIFNHKNAIDYTSRIITENVDDPLLIDKYKEILTTKLPSIEIRTRFTLEFNKILKDACQVNGIGYTDFISETLDPETQLLKDCFHDREDYDQYLKDSDLTRSLYISKLNSLTKNESSGNEVFWSSLDRSIIRKLCHSSQHKAEQQSESFSRTELETSPAIKSENSGLQNMLFGEKLKKAHKLQKQEKFSEAIQIYKKMLHEYPHFYLIYLKLGEALLHQGSLNESINQLHHAVKMNPSSNTACYTLGKALAQNNNHEEAIVFFRQAIKTSKNNIPKRFYASLGESLSKNGKFWKLTASARNNHFWKVGVAKAIITPRQSIWMAGYAARSKPSQGTLHDLWAKALVLSTTEKEPTVLITLDVCGLDRSLSNRIRDTLQKCYGLSKDCIVLSFSHTHTGPVVGKCLEIMYNIDSQQADIINEYTEFLFNTILKIVQQAFERMQPGFVSWGMGKANFAVNRSENKEKQVPFKRDRLNLEGPVDHDVPVLSVQNMEGELLAIIYGYACHPTVLNFYQLSGDYPGFANLYLETNYPSATAMFVAGCSGDQNPIPRGSVRLAKKYGEDLAKAVQLIIEGDMEPLQPKLKSAYKEVDLRFSELPTIEQIKENTKSKNTYVARHARQLLKQIQKQGNLPKTYPYPIQVWQLGDRLNWIFMGGEVVVKYSLKLKLNLNSGYTWVSGYCNDLCSYIPTKDDIKQHGYEGDRSMVYYGLPATWDENHLEEDIMSGVEELIKKVNTFCYS